MRPPFSIPPHAGARAPGGGIRVVLAVATLTTACAVLSACADEPAGGPSAGPSEEPAAGDEAFRALEGRTFRRSIVLVGSVGDTLLVVPWLVSARVHGGGVERSARALVLQGSTWEPVFEATWDDPPTRAPWRLLPHREMRVVVGMDDALERIVHDDGSRVLGLALGEVLTEWTGPRGGTFRLLEGSAQIGAGAVGGLMLDMSRAVAADEPGYGDWVFLVSGDSLQAVLYDPRREAGERRPGPGAIADTGATGRPGQPGEPDDTGAAGPAGAGQEPPAPGVGEAAPDPAPGTGRDLATTTSWQGPGVWRGWARLDFRELRWPLVRVEWADVRAFERARRDVPVSWVVSAPEDEIAGSLSAEGVQVEAGEGDGPQLPVWGLFGVRGTLTVEGRDYPVVGLLHHTQG